MFKFIKVGDIFVGLRFLLLHWQVSRVDNTNNDSCAVKVDVKRCALDIILIVYYTCSIIIVYCYLVTVI